MQGQQGGDASGDVGLRGKTRKAAKRALCPFINHKIIEVAETRDMLALLRVIRQYLGDMNLVNLTTSLHRLARLCSERPELKAALRQDPYQQVLAELLAAISGALVSSDMQLNDSRRQALSNIIWSLGTLRCVHTRLVQITATLASEQLHAFKPFELASTVWAFAKLGSLHPGVQQVVAPLLIASQGPVTAVVDKLGFRFLTMVAWALAASGLRDERLFARLGSRLLAMLRRADCSPELLVDVAWAFGLPGCSHRQLLAEVAQRAAETVADFEAGQLAELSRALAASGVDCSGLAAACACSPGLMLAPPRQLAEVIAGMAAASAAAGAPLGVAPLIAVCAPCLASFDATSLVIVAGAVSQCFAILPAPREVQEFLVAALAGARQWLPGMTGEPLADFVVALGEVRLAVPELLSAAAQQVIAQLEGFSASALARLLQSPAAWSPPFARALPLLFWQASLHAAALDAAERRGLAELAGGALGSWAAGGSDEAEEVAALCRSAFQRLWAVQSAPAEPPAVAKPAAPAHAWGLAMPPTSAEDDGGAECVDAAMAAALSSACAAPPRCAGDGCSETGSSLSRSSDLEDFESAASPSAPTPGATPGATEAGSLLSPSAARAGRPVRAAKAGGIPSSTVRRDVNSTSQQGTVEAPHTYALDLLAPPISIDAGHLSRTLF